MSQIILVVGATGAGKTSYARRLADEIGGICFSIDDWMGQLFWMDSPQPIEFEWTMERINRCEMVIFNMAHQAVQRGCAAILDLGFTKKEHRDKFRQLGETVGLTPSVHFVDVDVEARWARVQKRNHEKGETFIMPVDRAMFDFMEQMWEPPQATELAIADGIRYDS